MLELRNVCFAYGGGPPVLDRVSLTFPPGFNAILGPNGAGKSTLLKCVTRLLPGEGDILFEGRDITSLCQEELIRTISYLTQEEPDACSLRAVEVVLLGRLPDLGRRVKQEDMNLVLETMRTLNIEDLAMRKLHELSGGQRKLVYIAQALVRRPRLLLMDEPANSLDLQKQLELCHYLRAAVEGGGMSLLVVLHDLNLAARYADFVAVFQDGGILYASGPPGEVYTQRMLLDVYGIHGLITSDSGVPVVSPIRSIRT